MAKRTIDTKVEKLERLGLELLMFQQQKSKLDEEVKRRKEQIREEFDARDADVYDGEAVKLRVSIRPRYKVVLEKATNFVSFKKLRELGLLLVDGVGFNKYVKEQGIKAEPKDYEVAVGEAVEVRAYAKPGGSKLSESY